MNVQMIMALCILVFMVVMLLTHVLPYGVTAMICCVLFVFTGVLDLKTAFSGLSSSTTLMIAPMIVVASALGKTSLIHRLRGVMGKLQGKSGLLLILGMCGMTIVLSQLMGQVACISVMLLFIQTFDDDSEYSPSRLLFLVATINCLATSKFPIGMGATMPGTITSYYQGLVGPEDYLGITDFCKAGILPLIVGTIYCVLFYKLIPNGSIDKSQVKDVKDAEPISKKNEFMIFAVFIAIMLGFAFTEQLGSDITNVIPSAGLLILIVFKVLPIPEVMKTLTCDMVWMVAGMSVVSTALSKTGVGELIGQTVLNILGGHPSGLFVSIVFCVALRADDKLHVQHGNDGSDEPDRSFDRTGRWNECEGSCSLLLRICMARICNADRLFRNDDGIWYRQSEPDQDDEVHASASCAHADCVDYRN